MSQSLARRGEGGDRQMAIGGGGGAAGMVERLAGRTVVNTSKVCQSAL